MIGVCTEGHFREIHSIINDAASAYKGIIPDDCWHEPYMTEAELSNEIRAGVAFYGYYDQVGELLGVMGIQGVKGINLIRHAYIRTDSQRRGVGGELLAFLRMQTSSPMLIGTWGDAAWAIRFYEKHGFQRVPPDEKERLLQEYWTVPARQREVSVVLASPEWFSVSPVAVPPERR